MASFHNWLERILTRGESVQDAPPELPQSEIGEAEPLLRTAYATHALDVAGPPLAFDPVAACGAAVVLARACWFLVRDHDTREAVTLTLKIDPSPAAQLSADVTLRFLPAVYRRARLREPQRELESQVEQLLRAWPLSGVLADLDGSPSVAPEFGGHMGLQLLYTERLAATGRPGWVPVSPAAREWAERVYLERGKPLPAFAPEETHD
ncbi:MAG: hypothetical protein C0467_06775 [Planctomycetaceae bacterium]|nr:hypothetical protein [Planctomycetaceae bacterium]